MSTATAQDDLQGPPPPARSVFVFAAFALGMALAREGPTLPSALWFSLASAAGAVAVLTRSRACAAALACATLLLGAGVFTGRILERPSGGLSSFLTQETILTVEGLALDDPRQPQPAGAFARFGQARPRARFTLDVSMVSTETGWLAAEGKLVVAVPGSQWSAENGLSGFPVKAGQRVRLTGTARPPTPALNPGEPDRARYSAQDNIAGSLEVEDSSLVRTLDDDPGITARLRAALCVARERVRDRARAIIDPGPSADPRARALLLSLFLGIDEDGEQNVRRVFTHVGLAHVLAISGFHLTVMAYVALFLVRLTGERGRLEPAIVSALILLYLLAVPASAPVVRAGIVSLALMGAEARGRRYSPLAVLGWTGVLLLLWRPLDLWALGFQLSLGLTALLLWAGHTANVRLFGPRIRGTVQRPRALPVAAALYAIDSLKSGLSASLLCWSAGAPLIALRTGLFNPLAVLTTLVVLPPILLLMGAGYLALLIGILWPQVASPAAGALAALASVIVGLVAALDALPGSGVRVPPPSTLWAWGATVTVLWWFVRAHWRHAGAWALTVAVAAWLVTDLALRSRRESQTVLRADVLAVGDGTCIILRSGGESVMWNCGSTRLSIGESLVPRAARALGAWRIPTVVISSGSLDHVSGLLDAREPLGIRRAIVLSEALAEAEAHPEGPGAFALRELRRAGVEVVEHQHGTPLTFGIATLTVASAPAPDRARTTQGAIGVVTAGPTTVLLAGDVSAAHLSAIVSERKLPPPSLAELSSSAAADVASWRPPAHVAIVSCAQSEAIRLQARPGIGRSSLLITGTDGAISAEFGRSGALSLHAHRWDGAIP